MENVGGSYQFRQEYCLKLRDEVVLFMVTALSSILNLEGCCSVLLLYRSDEKLQTVFSAPRSTASSKAVHSALWAIRNTVLLYCPVTCVAFQEFILACACQISLLDEKSST